MKAGLSSARLDRLDTAGHVRTWLEAHGDDVSQYAFVPIRARFMDAVVAVNRSSGKVSGVIEVPLPKIQQ